MEDKKWYIGCSGFHYKEWKDIFYPPRWPQKKWFEYYSSQFKTLELNVTFYRFPQLSMLEGWYIRSTPDFIFSVKAPRLITHYKKFNESKELLADFYKIIRDGLKEKLGPILFQLPPQEVYSQERLNAIIENMDGSFENVIEFRHTSWWRKEVMDQLAEKRITFCGISHPKLPDDVIAGKNLSYYRFHGVPRLYYSSYSKDFLEKLVNDFKSQDKSNKIFLYFNNTATGAALENARYVLSLIEANKHK